MSYAHKHHLKSVLFTDTDSHMHNALFTVVKIPTLCGRQNSDWLPYFSNEESQVSVS